MSEAVAMELTVFAGPSLQAPFAAVAADFHSPYSYALPAETLAGLCAELLPQELRQRLALPTEESTFAQLAAALASAIQDLNGPHGLPMRVHSPGNGACRILLGYHDVTATTQALRAGLDLAAAMFGHAAGRPVAAQDVANLVLQMTALMQAYQPDFIARALIRAARSRGIPVSPVSPGSRTWLYGQGRTGYHFFEAANERDSLTGAALARNKYLSNQLITRLGFRGVVHGIADSAGGAAELARQIGFPVVVKPIASSKGEGITVGVATEIELDAALAKANSISPGQVLIERFVEGDDYRLSVFGGKLMRASRLSPPHIVGDGKRSVAQLIEAENRNRSDEDVASGLLIRVAVDAEMIAFLGKQGYTLADYPPEGMKLWLRKTANLRTGGTLQDVTASIHPDNVEMAEAIARIFHLDAAGIDFITPDLATSWRAIDCAVIEINATPGIGDFLAGKIITERFPPGSDGRIPSILLVGGTAELANRIVRTIRDSGTCVGCTDSATTLLADQQRLMGNADLPARIMSLLLDPACEALVVSCTPEHVAKYGLPQARFDVALIATPDNVPDDIRGLIGDHSAQLIEPVNARTLDVTALPAIAALFNHGNAHDTPPRSARSGSRIRALE